MTSDHQQTEFYFTESAVFKDKEETYSYSFYSQILTFQSDSKSLTVQNKSIVIRLIFCQSQLPSINLFFSAYTEKDKSLRSNRFLISPPYCNTFQAFCLAYLEQYLRKRQTTSIFLKHHQKRFEFPSNVSRRSIEIEVVLLNQYINTIIMKIILIFFLAFIAAASAGLLRTHNSWQVAQKRLVKTGAPYVDIPWAFCDLKCLYLERYFPLYDFAFITFSAGTQKPNFAACYVIDVVKPGVKAYTLWNNVVTHTWYERNCGNETENYFALTQGTDPKYKVVSVEGEGKGVEADY